MNYSEYVIDSMKVKSIILGEDGGFSWEEFPYAMQISKENLGTYFGFTQEHEARAYFQDMLFAETSSINVDIDSIQIKHVLEDIVKQVYMIAPREVVNVIIVPTTNSITLNWFKGVSGYVPNTSTILLHIPTQGKFPKTQFSGRLVQMYHHLGVREIWETLEDSWIYEGVGIHVAKHIIRGFSHPLEGVLTEGQRSKILKQVLLYRNSKSPQMYDDVFLGEANFPFGAGYSLGVWLISLLQEQSGWDIEEIITHSPKEIMGMLNI